MTRYVLVQMLEPAEIGQEFQRWPLHLTLVPWFEADLKLLVKNLYELSTQLSPFSFEIAGRETFGKNKKLSVHLVKMSPAIKELHHRLITIVGENNIEDKRFIGQNFRPHLTDRKMDRLKPSHKLEINSIWIVESVQERPQKLRRVVARLDFRGKSD